MSLELEMMLTLLFCLSGNSIVTHESNSEHNRERIDGKKDSGDHKTYNKGV